MKTKASHKGPANSKLGSRIREAREARSMTLAQLARSVGVSYVTAWNWETKGTIPRDRTLASLAKVLGVKEFVPTEASSGMAAPRVEPLPCEPEVYSLEELMRAITAKGFEVTVRPKAA